MYFAPFASKSWRISSWLFLFAFYTFGRIKYSTRIYTSIPGIRYPNIPKTKTGGNSVSAAT